MGVSRPRDSTTQLVDWLIAAAIALTVIVATAGIDFHLAGLTARAHSWPRMLAAVIALVLVRQRIGIAPWAPWLMRIAMLTAICGSVGTWFRFLLATIGGADSYGYVSASALIAHGRLIDAAPIAAWLSAPNRLAIASPLGWAPAPDGSGIAPTYPIGVSTLMAIFSLIGGPNAVFFVSPAAAMVTLYVVYRLARKWFDAETGLLAAAIVAWNPLFIAYAKQPMSDMTATMWMMIALALAVGISNRSALAAGLAAGAAVITRPALLIGAAMIPIASYRGDEGQKLKRLLFAGAGLAAGVLIQMAIQQHLFGSPFSTGYGSSAALFSTSHLTANLKIFFVRYGHDVVGPWWIPGMVVGLFAARPEPRSTPALVFAGVLAPYLFYLPFDHWETLRFLLPGLVPLTLVAADGLMHIARIMRTPAFAATMITLILLTNAASSESVLRHGSAWEVSSLEARYPLAGDWINVDTPPDSVVLANQHSGSLRWYGHRQTLRWDFIDPLQLTTTVRELQSHGATVYVALEGDEVKMFETRFAGVIDQLKVDPVGHVRNVSFLRLRAER